jgi:hypothetical protein
VGTEGFSPMNVVPVSGQTALFRLVINRSFSSSKRSPDRGVLAAEGALLQQLEVSEKELRGEVALTVTRGDEGAVVPRVHRQPRLLSR